MNVLPDAEAANYAPIRTRVPLWPLDAGRIDSYRGSAFVLANAIAVAPEFPFPPREPPAESPLSEPAASIRMAVSGPQFDRFIAAFEGGSGAAQRLPS